MPRNDHLKKILLIGSGPIVIGQGCEFDYSGVQACKALREEGYEVVLVNSNPATIMTDPEFADRTYIEPITAEVIEAILEREKPDAILPTMGGQTALNAAMELNRNGALVRHGVKLIGANAQAIAKGEDRQLFKEAMLRIGLEVPRSGIAHSVTDAHRVADEIGTLPLIIRPAFTLGGSGGGIAYNREELETIAACGLAMSPVNEVLIEESLVGWKEFEMEVMRDRMDNCVVICSIENFDPMGVHTGDSITVAPAQTLTDKEFQMMRDASFAVIREIGVETGGSNIQFAVNPANGRMVVIEMNPRVSRSSALASKATGFPIAKIAAKLAVGYTLDEIRNDITRETPASFEPTIDYCVVKVPRFTFEKFPQADATLTTQMKSVGEAMAIGRTFKEALQKALRSLEIKRFGFCADGNETRVDPETLRRKLAIPNADRIFHLAQALQDGMSLDEIYELTKIDRWFLQNLKQIVAEARSLGRACVSRAAPDVSSGAPNTCAEGAQESAPRDAEQHGRDARATKAEGTLYSRRRIPHFERPWAKYALTFATNKRKPLSPPARMITLDAIKHFHERRYELYAACVMPDHVHILFEPGIKEDDENGNPIFWSLGDLVASIKSFTAHEINKRAKTKGAVWEEEWHDRLIRSDKDLEEKFHYITRNPWDAGVVQPNEDYEWVWWPDKEIPGRAGVSRAAPDVSSGAINVRADGAQESAPRDAEQHGRDARATQAEDAAAMRRAKKLGFSDRQIAHLSGTQESDVRAQRKAAGIIPTYRLVDTCAAEFEAYTPYYYSTYGTENEIRAGTKRKIMILGGGPNRVGQGIEFDYCCVHAAFALRELGFETIMVNSNPETVSTDYDTSDKLYFEPLTLEDVLNIYDQEKPEGMIVQFGGQTPLNLANGLRAAGVPIIGTQPESIEIAEDRKLFAAMLDKLGLRQTPSGSAVNVDGAIAIAQKIGYPVLVRPSFVLGGRAMELVYNDEDLRRYMQSAIEVTPDRPVLVDRFLEDAIEVDVDCIADGETAVVGAIMEHIEQAGIHSGDSACVIPTFSLGKNVLDEITAATKAMARELNVRGLMNVQFAVKGSDVYVLEVNPRASRTVPFVSKAIGVPLAKLAAKVMTGKTLRELGFTQEIVPQHFSVKEAVFPYLRYQGMDISLGPEMKSTGEVMGMDADLGLAFAKSQMAAPPPLPKGGNVFISVKDSDKEAVIPLARQFIELGFGIIATSGTAGTLQAAGIPVQKVFKLREGRPNVFDRVINGDVNFIINTPSGKIPREDEVTIRNASLAKKIPIMTTVRAAQASLNGIRSLQKNPVRVKSLQEYHATDNEHVTSARIRATGRR
jgi:carbamoylphosphate synthase large subunit/REP element-mobilizing transposase RayT